MGDDVDSPTKGIVQERVEYFQGRQDETEARRLEEAELLKNRSPPKQSSTAIKRSDRVGEEFSNATTPDDPLPQSSSAPDLVASIETDADGFFSTRPALTQENETRRFDQTTRFGPTSRQAETGHLRPSNDASLEWAKSNVIEMVHEAERRLTRRSDSLENHFQEVDRSLTIAEQHSQESNNSDSSRERNASIKTLEIELEMAQRSYPKDSSDDSELIASREFKFDEAEMENEVVESLERTRAMMAEDDFVPSRRDKTVSHKKDMSRGQPMKKGSVVVRSFSVPPVSLRRGKSAGYLDSSVGSTMEMVHKQASFEVPLEVTNEGIKLSPKIAELSMITTIPPSRLGGCWSGSLEGKSSFGRSNTSSGSASLEYKASRRTRLSAGVVRGCENDQNLISVGGKLIRNSGTTVGFGLFHNPTFLHNSMKLDHWTWSVSYRHCFLDSKWSIFSQLSRRKDFSVVMTNKKLSARVGCNLRRAKQFLVRVDAHPRLSEYRNAHVYCQWKGGIWQFGVSLVQSLHSKIATVGLGWRLLSSRGIEWILSWNRGNATITIPVIISKELTNASYGQAMYLSLVSYLIQDCIGGMWGWIAKSIESNTLGVTPRPSTKLNYDPSKGRRDAEIQRELMARQARRKMKDEKEKNGLVIKTAIYKFKSENEWDVTTQLQFWVSHSTLTLPARPKSELLGFYDIAASQISLSSNSSSAWSWTDVWNDLVGDWNTRSSFLHKKPATASVPTLTIKYEFKGQSFCIAIKDREELRLPSQQATVDN